MSGAQNKPRLSPLMKIEAGREEEMCRPRPSQSPVKLWWITESIKTACNFDRPSRRDEGEIRGTKDNICRKDLFTENKTQSMKVAQRELDSD